MEKAYIKKVEKSEVKDTQESMKEHYLPHHPVVNPKKPGKVERVYNAATKFEGTRADGNHGTWWFKAEEMVK